MEKKKNMYYLFHYNIFVIFHINKYHLLILKLEHMHKNKLWTKLLNKKGNKKNNYLKWENKKRSLTMKKKIYYSISAISSSFM